MTTEKARKRAVRTRMAKTGERYAAARRHIVADDPSGPLEASALPPRAADPGMTEPAIAAGSGEGWDHWFRLLDGWGATERTHTDIARFVRDEQGVDGWWAQAVTVGYERARGLRARHQTTRGFEVSVSKTIAAPREEVWAAFLEAPPRAMAGGAPPRAMAGGRRPREPSEGRSCRPLRDLRRALGRHAGRRRDRSTGRRSLDRHHHA